MILLQNFKVLCIELCDEAGFRNHPRLITGWDGDCDFWVIFCYFAYNSGGSGSSGAHSTGGGLCIPISEKLLVRVKRLHEMSELFSLLIEQRAESRRVALRTIGENNVSNNEFRKRLLKHLSN